MLPKQSEKGSQIIEQRGKGNSVQDRDWEETECRASFIALCGVDWPVSFPSEPPFIPGWCLKRLPFALQRRVRLSCVFLWALLLSRQHPGSVLGTPVGKFSNIHFWAGWKGWRALSGSCVCGRSCLGVISKAGCHSSFIDPHHASWHLLPRRRPGNYSCFLKARIGSRNVVFPFRLISVLPT